MPVKKPPRVSKLRTHRATGQGYVVLNGRAIYPGRCDKPEAQRHHRGCRNRVCSVFRCQPDSPRLS
jgi:hypothetical protein